MRDYPETERRGTLFLPDQLYDIFQPPQGFPTVVRGTSPFKLPFASPTFHTPLPQTRVRIRASTQTDTNTHTNTQTTCGLSMGLGKTQSASRTNLERKERFVLSKHSNNTSIFSYNLCFKSLDQLGNRIFPSRSLPSPAGGGAPNNPAGGGLT
ncbi:hypothetical protein ZHAS_00017739 [Anopheles sinensis]|uniref:Uncharacterized protein n=1 Tax=Anopheles sinensis TaxID=74873 RepID=A0A084WH39_ANOSI|nr:hypothetical protein ZHAS_00017739 [Anopheles sinensis]